MGKEYLPVAAKVNIYTNTYNYSLKFKQAIYEF